MNEKIEMILDSLKRNVNNLKLSTKEDKKTYWSNVLNYDIDRLNNLLKQEFGE